MFYHISCIPFKNYLLCITTKLVIYRAVLQTVRVKQCERKNQERRYTNLPSVLLKHVMVNKLLLSYKT